MNYLKGINTNLVTGQNKKAFEQTISAIVHNNQNAALIAIEHILPDECYTDTLGLSEVVEQVKTYLNRQKNNEVEQVSKTI